MLFHSSDKVENAAQKHYKWAKHEPSEPAATSVLARWDGRCVEQGLRPEPSKSGSKRNRTGPNTAYHAGWMICRHATLFHWHGIQTVSWVKSWWLALN